MSMARVLGRYDIHSSLVMIGDNGDVTKSHAPSGRSSAVIMHQDNPLYTVFV